MQHFDKKIFFATNNSNKILEAQHVLSNFKILVDKTEIKKVEIQSDTLEEIVLYALKKIGKTLYPIVIEDSGLFIEKLNGFPGPYSSYVYKKIGCIGILKLLENENERRAKFVSIVGFRRDRLIKIFRGECNGKISYKMTGTHGFGFDPIFIPENEERTFAEMSLEEKCLWSHRGKAFKALGNWIKLYKYI
ncbi:MAG: XTP/dITP diphosphatase [Nitrososphaeria archaeon]|nr:XTP/dITP diphosphatase [Nitrososphaeria archaeon]